MSNVHRSVKLSTGHVIRVIMPGDDEFRSRDQLRLAMLEASIEFRKLADTCQQAALEAAVEDSG